MSEQLDGQGEAREALNSAVANFGPRVLSDPRMLGNVVADLLPDLPRERNLLVTGAEANVAGELRRHVEEQHVSLDTAVQLVAGALTERWAIDPAATMWVATEYARALGYPVRPVGQSAPSRPGTLPSGPDSAPPRRTGLPPQGPPPAPGWTGAPFADYGRYPPTAPAGGQPQGPGWPPTPVPPQDVSRPRRRNRGPIIAAAGVAGVVVLYLVIAAAAGIPPFATSSSRNALPTPNHSTTHPTPHPTSSIIPLVQLLPADVDQPSTQCHNFAPPFNAPGMTQGLECTDPGLPNGAIEAYQMNSNANYQAAWNSFNSWWGFNNGTPGPSCPPAAGNTNNEGTETWYDTHFPERAGQVVECEWTTGSNNNVNNPSYAWTFPTENAFIIAWGGANTTFATLNTWFWNTPESIYSSASPSAS